MATVREHLEGEIQKWTAELARVRERRAGLDVLDEALLSSAGNPLRVACLHAAPTCESREQLGNVFAQVDSLKPERLRGEPSVMAMYDRQASALEDLIVLLNETLQGAAERGLLNYEYTAPTREASA